MDTHQMSRTQQWGPSTSQSHTARPGNQQESWHGHGQAAFPPPYLPNDPQQTNQSSRNYTTPLEFPETNQFRNRATSVSRLQRSTDHVAREPPEFHSNSSLPNVDGTTSQQALGMRNASFSTYFPPSSRSQPAYGDIVLSQAVAVTEYHVHIPSNQHPLSKPIALPQTRPGLGQSFARAWAPELLSKGISQAEFLAFIDNLDVIATKNPPLQIVDAVGGIIGMVPHHLFAIAGIAVQATAKLGTAAVSKGRTELYLREVNQQMFGPRGLKVSIASTLATREILKVPRSLPMLVPLNDETFYLSNAERAVLIVAPYSAYLDLNVPPPVEQTTFLAKLSARQVASQEKKDHKKVMKKRDDAIQKAEKKERESEKKAGKKGREREKKDRKRRKHERGEGSDSSISGSDSEVERRKNESGDRNKRGTIKMKEYKEEKGASKLLWLVIENM